MGQAPKGTSYNNAGEGLPLLAGAGDFGTETPQPSKFTTQPTRASDIGDIILCIRATIGDRNWSDKPYCLGRGVAGLSPISDQLDGHYLWHLLAVKTPDLMREAKGSTFKQIGKETIESLEIPLPPLEEQKRIAAILDKADAIRKKRKEAIELTEQFLRSAFLEMFGDPITNPKGWPVVELGSVINSKLGKMLSKASLKGINPIPYLGNSNVRWRQFDFRNLASMDFTEGELLKLDLVDGDLLVCEGGEVGRCAIWRQERFGISFQKALHRVRCNTNQILPEFLQEFFFHMSQYGGLVRSTSSATIAHLTGVKLKGLSLPLPPIELQQQFVLTYQKHTEMVSKYNTLTERQQDIFSSLIQRAFKSEL